MGTITQAMAGSYKSELAQAVHNHTTTTGHVFKCALIKPAPTGTFDASSTNYSNLSTDEVASGGGYTTGGFAWTAAQNVTPSNTAGQAFWSWSANPQWTSASFSTAGAMIYNSSASNKAVGILSFGGTQTVVSATFTINLPANAAGTSICQIN